MYLRRSARCHLRFRHRWQCGVCKDRWHQPMFYGGAEPRGRKPAESSPTQLSRSILCCEAASELREADSCPAADRHHLLASGQVVRPSRILSVVGSPHIPGELVDAGTEQTECSQKRKMSSPTPHAQAHVHPSHTQVGVYAQYRFGRLTHLVGISVAFPPPHWRCSCCASQSMHDWISKPHQIRLTPARTWLKPPISPSTPIPAHLRWNLPEFGRNHETLVRTRLG